MAARTAATSSVKEREGSEVVVGSGMHWQVKLWGELARRVVMGVQVEMWCHAPGMKIRVGLWAEVGVGGGMVR